MCRTCGTTGSRSDISGERVTLRPYEEGDQAFVLRDIVSFWQTHYNSVSTEEAREELSAWTSGGHELYIILSGGMPAGFLHLGSRGGGCDWLEDIFVREDVRNRGIGSAAIACAWSMLRERGGETMYLEVVPANAAAIRLYHRLGFTNLNTLTLNRSVKKKQQWGTETISGLPFKTYRPHQG